MKFPFVSRLRRASRNRAFARANPDVRHIYAKGRPAASPRPAAPLSAEQMEHWNEHGFLVLKSFHEPSVIEAYKRNIDTLWRTRARPGNPLVMYSDRRGKHHFRDAVEEDRGPGYRLLDHYLVDTPTRDFCMDPRLTAILHQLLGHTPVVCNSLLFEWGSEQDLHSDMFYMSPLSENQMLATWLAIDDVTEDNGPLLYVPGSHKLPPHRFSHGRIQAIPEEVAGMVDAIQAKMDALGLKPERFLAERGDLFIWHGQLMHGGSAIRDRAATRASLVTHYYSTLDIPTGPWSCAERTDGTLLMVKEHVPVAPAAVP